jgi:hypothetical protein
MYTDGGIAMSSSWDIVQVNELSKDLLDGLFANDIAAVRIPNFVSPESCRIVSETVVRNGFDYYETLDPPLGRIGIAQYDHRDDKAEYFRQAELAHQTRERIFAEAGDPIPTVIDALTPAWPGKVGLATEDAYGAYFAGIVRITVGGIKVHCDWAQHDSIGWHVGTVTSQLVWNLYYDVTEEGGLTTLYRRPSTPDIESYAEGAWGFYRPEAVEDCESHTVRPVPGEVILFNSRNAHAVSPATGAGVRVSASSFVGSMADNSLILWS